MANTALDIKLKTLPNSPGVYQYYDENGTIIYVGKAKNLKNRVKRTVCSREALAGAQRLLRRKS